MRPLPASTVTRVEVTRSSDMPPDPTSTLSIFESTSLPRTDPDPVSTSSVSPLHAVDRHAARAGVQLHLALCVGDRHGPRACVQRQPSARMLRRHRRRGDAHAKVAVHVRDRRVADAPVHGTAVPSARRRDVGVGVEAVARASNLDAVADRRPRSSSSNVPSELTWSCVRPRDCQSGYTIRSDGYTTRSALQPRTSPVSILATCSRRVRRA